MSIQDQLYPFSTRDGRPIPTDIMLPLGVGYVSAGDSAWSTLTMPDEWEMACFYAAEDSLVDLSGEATAVPVASTVYSNYLFIPYGFLIVAKLMGPVIKVISLTEPGTVVVQGIQKWAGIAQNNQLTNITARR